MGKTILLTGGTGKFGRVLARYFISRGWEVVITSRDEGALDSLRRELSNENNGCHSIALDLQVEGAPEKLLADLTERGLVISHLINNARSISTLEVGESGVTDRNTFLGEFELDVIVPYELTLALAQSSFHQLMSVVNIGSQYGLVVPNPALYEGSLKESPIQYGVSKAGVHQLTKELAVRLAPQNIRVNCVAFGGVEGRVNQAFVDRYAELTPSRRMLYESEIPGPIEFLLSESSTAINGHVMVADGGWSLW